MNVAALVLAVASLVLVVGLHVRQRKMVVRMGNQQEQIDEVVSQLNKVKQEFHDAVAGLEQEIADGIESSKLDLSALKSISQELDDLNPDEIIDGDDGDDEPVDPEPSEGDGDGDEDEGGPSFGV